MKEHKRNLEHLLHTVSKVIDVLLYEHSATTTWGDILVELTEGNKNNELIALANQKLSTREIVNLLLKRNFLNKCQRHKQIVKVEVSLIPQSIQKNINEQLIKNKGEIWKINKSDKDPFPSIPHAHNSSTGLKLHLGNGNLYLKTKLVGKMSKKNLKLLRSKIKSVDLPELII